MGAHPLGSPRGVATALADVFGVDVRIDDRLGRDTPVAIDHVSGCVWFSAALSLAELHRAVGATALLLMFGPGYGTDLVEVPGRRLALVQSRTGGMT